MLVICALALVAAAAVFLVIGLAGGDVGDLYLSMVLCVASLVVVAVSARLSRIRPAPAAGEPPAPVAPTGADEAADDDADDEDEDETSDEPGATADEPVAAPAAGLPDRLAKRPAPETTPVDDGSIWAAGRPAADPAPVVEPEVEGGTFPIADYDDLDTAQILPLVPRLWPEEVPVVAARERATKARPAVLDALAAVTGDPAMAFPIAEYETLDTEQITRLLNRLDETDLATVQAAERAGPARVGVLVAVANQLAARK